MYLRAGAWQVTLVDPVTAPLAAVIVAEPLVVAPAVQLTKPVELTVATLGTLELHTTLPVRGCEGPEENNPVAVNCAEPPVGRVRGVGASEMEFSTGAKQVTDVDPVVVPAAVAPVAE